MVEATKRIAPPSVNCPIPWRPSPLTPVFYGVRDYGPDDGAPGPCRVFFPSLDGSPYNAEMLTACGRYPLVLFMHGGCSADLEQYKSWFQLPSTLARAGYVVAVPKLSNQGPTGGDEDIALLGALDSWLRGAHPNKLDSQPLSARPEELRSRLSGAPPETLSSLLPSVLLGAVNSWLHDGWEHHSALLPPPMTGVVGHSYGAIKAARLAAESEGTISAYVGLSGPWEEWPPSPPNPPPPLRMLQVPNLLTWGSGPFDSFADGFQAFDGWPPVPMPRHLAIFEGAAHWDYLKAGTTTCDGGVRGPCELTHTLAADLTTMFLGRYLPGENSNAAQIPPSLIPPEVKFTQEQELFSGSWLQSFSELEPGASCKVTLSWEVGPSDTGSTTRP